ncbi:hypothetical protein RFI_13301, partial [Reticulomyxa filosa]
MFNCKKINGEFYLWNAGSLKCYEPWQFVFVGIYGLVLLFPILICWRLWRLSQEYDETVVVQVRYLNYAAFTRSYSKRSWWYESVMMGRRILIISIYSAPVDNPNLIRALMAFACGGILAFHAYARPFLKKENNFYETVLLMTLFLVATLSTVDTADKSTMEYVQTGLCIIPLIFLPWLCIKYCGAKVHAAKKNEKDSKYERMKEDENHGNEEGDDDNDDNDNDNNDNEREERSDYNQQSLDPQNEMSLSSVSFDTGTRSLKKKKNTLLF